MVYYDISKRYGGNGEGWHRLRSRTTGGRANSVVSGGIRRKNIWRHIAWTGAET
jgi:hypothetical protein